MKISLFVRCVCVAIVALTGHSLHAVAEDQPEMSIEELYQHSAGGDLQQVRRNVERLAELSSAHIAEKGLKQAIIDFQSAPWKRNANGLHIWGVTLNGMS
jgi:hypothetical protein